MIRREFSKEFKQDAISLVLGQGYTRIEAAKSLGIHPVLLSRWIREHQADESSAFRGRGKLRSDQVRTNTSKKGM
jgi:transposase